jgi:DNA repair exonuclease SbcCD ATPase subunit
MSGLAGMFGQLDAEDGAAAAPAETPAQNPAQNPADVSAAEPIPESGTGQATAALRNLLVDAKLKVLQFDDYKAFFAGLVEPAAQALRTLEHAQTRNIDLQRQLGEITAQCTQLRARLAGIETQQARMADENDTLRVDLELAHTAALGAEQARSALAGEILLKADAIEDLERRLSVATAQASELNEETARLRTEAAAAEEKSGLADAELSAARDKADLLESELASLHKSLDDAAEQEAGRAKRLADSETALAAVRARLSQLEAVNEELHAERDRLRAALDANGIQHDGQQSRLQMQIEAARARAAATEKLLAEARAQLAQRSEDVRTSGQRQVESNYARERTEKRVAAQEAEIEALRAALGDAKKDRDRLIEMSNVAANALRLRETQLQRAEEAALKATERTARLQADTRDGTDTSRLRIEQLTTWVERERLAHRTTKSALQATRDERDKLQADLLQAQLELNRRSVSNDTDLEFPSGGANAA